MEQRSMAFGLAGFGAVVAAFAALVRAPTSGPVVTPVAPPASASGEVVTVTASMRDTARASYDRGSRLIEEYLRRRVGEGGTGRASGARPDRSPAAPRTAGRKPPPLPAMADTMRHSLQVVIATVPDPFDSHLDWAYDAYLEALQRAFGAAGYVPDRYWLPAHADSIRIHSSAKNADTITAPLHDYYPGAFLFRGRQEKDRSLALLYVVYELPTAGVHKEAFLAAVRERRVLMGDAISFRVEPAVREQLLVAGPVFSGATRSLRLAIDDALTFVDSGVKRVRVVSGAATSDSNAFTLTDPTPVELATPPRCESFAGSVGDGVKRCSDSDDKPGEVRLSVAPRISFQGTVNPDGAMRLMLDSIADILAIPPDRVAVLSETSTLYGEQGSDGPYLSISFPLNIASLRSEVDRSSDATDAASVIPGISNAPRTRLSLQEQSRHRETPAVASGLTVPSMDLVLEAIVRTLVEKDVRAVVIRATDIRDKLMLAREIKRRMRNTQIITFESHRLLLRPEFSHLLNGTLVISSYPLAVANQWWTLRGTGSFPAAPEELETFPSDLATGVFNAALTLLGRSEARVEYEPPLSIIPVPRVPPIWVTAVANGVFVPVSVTPSPASFGSYFGPDAQQSTVPRRVAYPAADVSPQNFFYLAVLLFGLLLAGASVFVLVKRRKLRAGVVPQSRNRNVSYALVEAQALEIHERIYSTLLVVALVGAFLPSAMMLPWSRHGWVVDWLVLVVAVFASLALALGVTDVFRLLGMHGRDGVRFALRSRKWRDVGAPAAPGRTPTRRLLSPGRREQLRWIGEIVTRTVVAVSGLLYLGLVLIYAWEIRELRMHDPQRFLLLSFRSLQVLSGASPLLPLTICGLGFALWSAWHWRQVDHLQRCKTSCEIAAGAHQRGRRTRPLSDAMSRASAHIEEARERSFRLLPTDGGFLLSLLLCVVGMITYYQHLGTIERFAMAGRRWPLAFDALFWLGTFAMLVTGAWATYRITSIWTALQGALDALAETPLYNAFGRLPHHVSKLTRLTIFTSPGSAGIESTSGERWRELQSHVGDIPSLIRRSDQLRAARTQRELRLDHLIGSLSANMTASHAAERTGTPPAPESELSPIELEIATVLQKRLQHRCGEDLYAALSPEARARILRKLARTLTFAWSRVDSAPSQSGNEPTETVVVTPRIRRILRTAEELLAIESMRYVESVLQGMRRLASFLLVALLLSVVLLSSYPFQPQGIVKLSFVILLLGTVLALFVVMTQMSRNDVLSQVSRTDPGRISWNTTFVFNIILLGVVPLLALASSEFPAIRTLLFSWAEPLAQSLGKS
jgi:hypothetical protein